MNTNKKKLKFFDLIFDLMMLTLIVISFGKLVISANAYQENKNQIYNENNQEDFYLNLDLLNLNKQNFLIDIDNVKSNISHENKTITIALSYNNESSYDIDNDGIENLRGVIDFSISNTNFNWNAGKKNLCTRWEIYSIENNRLATICYGNYGCCKFVNLAPIRSNWSEALYLTYGMHGASENNIISAQVIYVDYNLSAEKPYADIYYSKWSSLSAIFRDNINLIKNISIENALRNIEKIRSKNNKIQKIELRDKDGNELKEIRMNKNISIAVNISEAIVSINNFDALTADWNKSDSINITTENNELSNSLKEAGISPKAIVSVHGMSNFLGNESYYGSVKLSITDSFNSVIYCPDDKISSCRIMPKCSYEFKGIECYIKNNSMLTIYVPHFSSIIVAWDNATSNLTINNPDNSSILQSGENIYLNFTINQTVNANYTLDSQGIVALGNGTSFISFLNGTLPYGVIKNGLHNISIFIKDGISNSAIINYSFAVNDTKAPNITINITNNSVFSGTSLLLSVNISSNEYANISYKINGNTFSAFADLGANKSKILNITPTSGINNLTINASDLQYNSNLNFFSFNFTLAQAPSCSDAAQNGDETGIDCGGSCSSCINFTVSTDKPAYNLTDNAYITVIARANSTVNVTATRQGILTYRHNFVPVFVGSPIAETRIIANTSNAGNYTINAIMYYLNVTENKNVTFEVVAPSSSPISVTINANATTINEGDTILFASAVSGNSSAVSYKWDFQNDGTIDSTSATSTYTYPSNGTFTVNLTVSDSKWSQTDIEVITVKKLYNLAIIVKDNETSNAIENADVEFDDALKTTGSDGIAAYVKNAGKYYLLVKKSGYITFSNKTEVTGNGAFEVMLIQQDNQSPRIQIISPEDKVIISNASMKFKYKAVDKSATACKLYSRTNSSLWKLESLDNNIVSDAESAFILTNLQNNMYEWQIECTDANGNSNASSIYTFSVDTSLVDNRLSVDLNEEDKKSDDIIAQIDAAIANLDSLASEEKEAAEAMQLKKTLEKAKVAVQRANRDLHSLKWRRLNATEIEDETKKILERIKNVRDATPKKIEILDKNEFVKYPSKEDVGKALQVLLNSTNLKFTKKELNALIQENHKLQSLITVTTKTKIINAEYISGDKKTITLIQKIVNSQKNSEKNLDGLVFFEVIPKELASNITEVELLFDYEIIDKEPVVQIDLQKIKDFSYYLNKRLSLDDTEKLKSILLSKNLKSYKNNGNSITGFAAFGGISSALTSSDFVKTSDIRLIIEFAVIILLAIVFLYYQFGDFEKVRLLFNNELRQELGEFDYLINKISDYLNQSKYDEAKLLYKEIDSIFKKLPKNAKGRVYNKIVGIHNKMDFVYMDKSLKEAMDSLDNNQKENALHFYSVISGLYKNLPKEYKSRIHLRCMELHKKLNP